MDLCKEGACIACGPAVSFHRVREQCWDAFAGYGCSLRPGKSTCAAFLQLFKLNSLQNRVGTKRAGPHRSWKFPTLANFQSRLKSRFRETGVCETEDHISHLIRCLGAYTVDFSDRIATRVHASAGTSSQFWELSRGLAMALPFAVSWVLLRGFVALVRLQYHSACSPSLNPHHARPGPS